MTGPTRPRSRSSACAAPRPGRPGCGQRWRAESSAIRSPGAGSRRWRMLVLAAPALGMRLGNPFVDLPGTLRGQQALGPDLGRLPRQPDAGRGGRDRTGRRQPGDARAPWPRSSSGRRRAVPLRAPITATRVAGGHGLLVDVPLAGDGGTSGISDDALLDPPRPGAAGDARPGRRRQLRGHGEHRDDVRLQHHSALAHAGGFRRGGGRPSCADDRLPLAGCCSPRSC